MSENKVKIPKSFNKPAVGAFGIVSGGNIGWQSCRETFQTVSEPAGVMEFLFHHHTNRAEDVIEFMRTVEQILRLPDEHCIEIKETTETNILHIKLSPWWKYRLRRSLLTALLRCGQHYTKHTGSGFETALWSQSYTAATKYAVERFLAGYTASKLKKRTGFAGWQNLFTHQANADTYLVKLKRKRLTTELTGEVVPEPEPQQ